MPRKPGRSLHRLCIAATLCAVHIATIAVEQPPLRILKGACGTLGYVAKLGGDYESALAAVQARNYRKLDCGARGAPCRFEPYEITVTPEQDVQFFALRVLDSNGMLVHSVSQVLTTDGQLFVIHWCPD